MSHEENQKLAEQHGFAFAACMICQHKPDCPTSEHCKRCIEDTTNHESKAINYQPT